jgi:hypothetical protein
MYTEIITPTQSKIVLELPAEMIGKKIEIKATEIEELQVESMEARRKRIEDIFADCRVDLSNFKFDRDEANNY